MTVRARQDEWVERTRSANGRVIERWLERVIDANTGHVECVTLYAMGADAFEDPRVTDRPARAAVRGTPAAMSRRARVPRPRELEIRSKPSLWTVVLSSRVRSALNKMDLSSTHEIGGGLFGQWDGITIHIEEAVANPAPPHGYEARRVYIDSDYMRREEANYYSRHGLSWIGDWHTHPSFEGERADASDGDFNGWAAALRESPGLYVGLIIHPSLRLSEDPFAISPWCYPRRSAWVVRTSEGRILIEPVDVLTETASGPLDSGNGGS